jgi:glycine/D-amino acid oxidase-like deaminating enzyme
MNLLSLEPFWPIRDGLPANYPALRENVSCDVAIIGAGISGALAAWHLCEAGLDVVVLDRRDVAHGSTAGSTSLLQYEIDEPLHKLARRLGPGNAARAYHSCRDAIDGLARLTRKLRLDCHFKRKASLFLARDRSHLPRLRAEFVARSEAGFDVEWWDRRRLVSASSLPHPAGILSRDGGQLDSYLLTHGLLAAARRKGARIHDRTTVTARHPRARSMELRTDTEARITARHLVIATGYETATFPLARRYTRLHSTYALISEPVTTFPGWPADRCLLWETGDPYTYLRTTSDNRVVIGGYDEPFSDPAARDRLLGAKTRSLQRRLRQLLPAIKAETAYAWAGTFAKTRDGLPLIGSHPGIPRTWFALGYGGNGITYSYIAARLIRDQILGHPNTDGELLGFARFETNARG